MKITQFGVAYAYRSHAAPQDIRYYKTNYEDAVKAADSLLCDDDDSRVWFLDNGIWYCVFYRDTSTGNFVVSKNEINLNKAYISNYY